MSLICDKAKWLRILSMRMTGLQNKARPAVSDRRLRNDVIIHFLDEGKSFDMDLAELGWLGKVAQQRNCLED